MDGIYLCKYNPGSPNPKLHTMNHVGQRQSLLLRCCAAFSSGSRCQQKLTEWASPRYVGDALVLFCHSVAF